MALYSGESGPRRVSSSKSGRFGRNRSVTARPTSFRPGVSERTPTMNELR